MEAIGPVLMLTSIPLIFRWIPQNRVYGFRIAATLRNESVWYDANARCGRHLFLLGLLMVLLELVLPMSIRTQTLMLTAITGLVLVIVIAGCALQVWPLRSTNHTSVSSRPATLGVRSFDSKYNLRPTTARGEQIESSPRPS